MARPRACSGRPSRRPCGAGIGARPACTASRRSRATSPTGSAAPTTGSSDVIYPPVDVQRFEIAETTDDYYLVVSALVPYKRVDLAVAAAARLGRRLVIVGTGPEESRLRALAGPMVSFLGWRSDTEIARLYARCRALIFPGVEDFGITPLEGGGGGPADDRAGAGVARSRP
jgi:glycosyltransferase involved in cell wall biosynthesis